jgi:transcription elongation factor Elf1
MSNKKTCCICYNKNTNDNLKCKTCKNCVCDICYANIIYNNIEFSLSYNKNETLYKCPFCNNENIFSTTINNYNTNDNLIKLLLKTMNTNNIEFNNLVDDLETLRIKNLQLQDELNLIKNINYNLSTEVKSFKLKLEYKPPLNDKLQEVEKILNNSKNKNTILYRQIKTVLF